MLSSVNMIQMTHIDKS